MRKKLHIDDETEVLIKSRRRCCLCTFLNNDSSVKKGQIAHADKNSSNRKRGNLVFLCLEHHDEYDSKPSQSKGVTKKELKHYRDRLYKHTEGGMLEKIKSETDIKFNDVSEEPHIKETKLVSTEKERNIGRDGLIALIEKLEYEVEKYKKQSEKRMKEALFKDLIAPVKENWEIGLKEGETAGKVISNLTKVIKHMENEMANPEYKKIKRKIPSLLAASYLKLAMAYGDTSGKRVECLQKALDLSLQAEDKGMRVPITILMAGTSIIRGKFEEAEKYYRKALRYSKTDNYKFLVLSHLGHLYLKLNDLTKALEHYQKALESVTANRSREDRINAYHNIGYTCFRLNDLVKAETSIKKAKSIAKKAKKENLLLRELSTLGVIYLYQQEYKKAENILRQTISQGKKLNDDFNVANALGNLGNVLMDLEEYDESLECYKKSLKLFKKLKEKQYIAMAKASLSRFYFIRGQMKLALKYIMDTYEIDKENKDISAQLYDINQIATIYREQRNIDEAIKYLRRGLRLTKTYNIMASRPEILGAIGYCYRIDGQIEKSLKYYKEAIEICHDWGDKNNEAFWYANIAHVYRDLGEFEDAENCYSEALRINIQIDDEIEIAHSYNNFGLFLLRSRNRFFEAISSLEAAREMYHKLGVINLEVGLTAELATLHISKLGNMKEGKKLLNKARKLFINLGDEEKTVSTYSQLIGLELDCFKIKNAVKIIDEGIEEMGKAGLSIVVTALKDMKGQIDNHESLSTIIISLGTEAEKRNDLNHAIKCYIRAKKLLVNTQSHLVGLINYNLGYAYQRKDDQTNAEKYYIKALAISTTEAWVLESTHNNIGLLYLHQEKYDLAIKHLEKHHSMVNQDDDETRNIASTNLALAFRLNNDAEKAHEILKKELKLCKDKRYRITTLLELSDVPRAMDDDKNANKFIVQALSEAKTIEDAEMIGFSTLAYYGLHRSNVRKGKDIQNKFDYAVKVAKKHGDISTMIKLLLSVAEYEWRERETTGAIEKLSDALILSFISSMEDNRQVHASIIELIIDFTEKNEKKQLVRFLKQITKKIKKHNMESLCTWYRDILIEVEKCDKDLSLVKAFILNYRLQKE